MMPSQRSCVGRRRRSKTSCGPRGSRATTRPRGRPRSPAPCRDGSPVPSARRSIGGVRRRSVQGRARSTGSRAGGELSRRPSRASSSTSAGRGPTHQPGITSTFVLANPARRAAWIGAAARPVRVAADHVEETELLVPAGTSTGCCRRPSRCSIAPTRDRMSSRSSKDCTSSGEPPAARWRRRSSVAPRPRWSPNRRSPRGGAGTAPPARSADRRPAPGRTSSRTAGSTSPRASSHAAIGLRRPRASGTDDERSTWYHWCSRFDRGFDAELPPRAARRTASTLPGSVVVYRRRGDVGVHPSPMRWPSRVSSVIHDPRWESPMPLGCASHLRFVSRPPSPRPGPAIECQVGIGRARRPSDRMPGRDGTSP